MREPTKPEAEPALTAELRVPLVAETATLGKRRVASGKVTVKTSVETDHRVLTEQLSAQAVDVERVPVGRVIRWMPDVRTEGDVTIIPVLEERLVVTKQLVLVEEIRIRRRKSVETVEVPVSLRREAADIETVDSEGVLTSDQSPRPR